MVCCIVNTIIYGTRDTDSDFLLLLSLSAILRADLIGRDEETRRGDEETRRRDEVTKRRRDEVTDKETKRRRDTLSG